MDSLDIFYTLMFLKTYGSKQIFRPRWQTAAKLHEEAKYSINQRFSVGLYVGRDEVNPIIQHLFDFYDQKLRSLAPLIASRDMVDFLLYQYDEATEILHGDGILDLNERREWLSVEPIFRRAIKYVVELLCIQQRKGDPQIARENTLLATEIALECAEVAADLAEMSNRVHSLFPENCSVKVHGRFNPQAISIEVTGRYSGYDRRFMDRMVRDRMSRDRFVELGTQFDIHTDSHSEYLDPAFLSSFGVSYAEFIAGICAVIEGARPAGEGHFPTLFIRRSDLFRQLCESGRPPTAIDAMLRGFSVTPIDLVNEKRVLWNPKQHSRAYRKGFFSFAHETGEHLAFSKSMAQESLIHLVSGVCFQKLPKEWMTLGIHQALASLSNAAGDWFEQIVSRNLRSLGYHGGRLKGSLRRGGESLSIPPEVGELDFLGFHAARCEIILIEAKMTCTGLEAQFWRDDVKQFVWGRKPYADQFRRKREWVLGNLGKVQRLLGAPKDCKFESRILTLYPCIAAEFIDDFTCESITEFMLGMERNKFSES